jgi:hypothetical protein
LSSLQKNLARLNQAQRNFCIQYTKKKQHVFVLFSWEFLQSHFYQPWGGAITTATAAVANAIAIAFSSASGFSFEIQANCAKGFINCSEEPLCEGK